MGAFDDLIPAPVTQKVQKKTTVSSGSFDDLIPEPQSPSYAGVSVDDIMNGTVPAIDMSVLDAQYPAQDNIPLPVRGGIAPPVNPPPLPEAPPIPEAVEPSGIMPKDNAFRRGLKTSLGVSVPEMIGSGIEMGWAALPGDRLDPIAESVAGGLRGIADENRQAMPQLQVPGFQNVIPEGATINDLPEILSRAGTFAGEGLGQGIGSMLPTIAGMGAGAGLGFAAAGPAGALVGSPVGGLSTGFIQNYGEIAGALAEEAKQYNEANPESALTKEELGRIALIPGAMATGLDYASLKSLLPGVKDFSKFVGLDPKTLAKELLKDYLKGAGKEGLTEGAQGMIKSGTAASTFDRDITLNEYLDAVNEGIIGGITGGTVQAGTRGTSEAVNAGKEMIRKAIKKPDIIETDEAPDTETAIQDTADNVFSDLIPEQPVMKALEDLPVQDTVSEMGAQNVPQVDNVPDGTQVQEKPVPESADDLESRLDKLGVEARSSEDGELKNVLQRTSSIMWGRTSNGQPQSVIDALWAQENNRPDIVRAIADRDARWADNFNTTPGVPEDSPKYDQIKNNLEAMAQEARDIAAQTAFIAKKMSEEGKKKPSETKALKEVPGKPTIQKLVTPRGDQEIEASFDVVDAGNLITSDNENFPQILQPRDRTRMSSDLQIQDIANRVDPERLAESRTTDTGAPIVSTDNIVESGNGRVMGIRKAYEMDNEASKNYRAAIEARGFDTSGMTAPVLVRRRRTELSPEDRVRFTIASNERTGAAMSSTERAMADAKVITEDIATLFKGGDVTSGQNSGFVKAFMDSIAPADRGTMIGPDGALSQDGVRRLKSALLARAYEDSDIIQSLIEDTDTEIKSIGNALTNLAGTVTSFRASVEKGETPSNLDITPKIIDAAKIVRDARANNRSMAEVLGQTAMFKEQEIDPITERIIRGMYQPSLKRPVSAEKIEAFLRKYYEEANKAETGANMFGLPDVTPESILDLAKPQDILSPLEEAGQAVKESVAAAKEPAPIKDGVLPDIEPKPSPLSEKKAKILAEKAEPMLDIKRQPTGWKKLETQDRITLINPETGETVAFNNPDPKSGTAAARMRAEAQAYAIDNPVVREETAPADLVVEPMFKKDEEKAKKPQRTKVNSVDVNLTDDMRGVFDKLLAGKSVAGASGEASFIDRSSKVPFDVDRMSKTQRASLTSQLWRDAGIDPDEAARWPLKKQYLQAKKQLEDVFGIKVEMGWKGKYRHAVDNMLDLYVGMKAMAALNGLSERAIGLKKVALDPEAEPVTDGLKLVFKSSRSMAALGVYNSKENSITIPGRANSFAHEWMHALDYHVLESMGEIADGLGKRFRGYSGKIRRVGEPNYQADSVAEAWVDLMNTIFFDDAFAAAKIMELEQQLQKNKNHWRLAKREEAQAKIDRIKQGNYQGRDYRSPYYRAAKSIPAGSDKGYWTRPTEMVARAFEAYTAQKLKDAGQPTDIMTMSGKAYDPDGPFEKLYPQGADRERIFLKIEQMMQTINMANLLNTGDLAPATMPVDQRNDPLEILKQVDMRKAPEGIRGMIARDAAWMKKTIHDTFVSDRKQIEKDVMKKSASSISEAVANVTSVPMERKTLSLLVRNPDRVKKPEKMSDTRFAELKSAAKKINQSTERPIDNQGILTKLNTARMVAFSSEKTAAHVLEKRNPPSAALSRIITNVYASPGVRRDSANTYIGRKREFINKYGNRLAAILEVNDLGDSLNKTERRALRYMYFHPNGKKEFKGVSAERMKELSKAAAELNRMIKDISYEFDRAGIDLGETSNAPYLRRIYDKAKISRDKRGFISAATETYLVKYERDMGKADDVDLAQFIELAEGAGFRGNQEIAVLKQAVREAKAQSPAAIVRGEVDESLYDMITSTAAIKDANDWWTNMFVSPEFSPSGAPSGFMKARVLPPEADDLLENYMVADPVESTMSLIEGAAEQVAWKTLVEPEESALLNAERQALNDGWDAEDAASVVEMIRSMAGRGAASKGLGRGISAVFNSLHVASTALLMARSVFASLHEPGTYYMRTGHAGGYLKVWGELVKGVFQTADAMEKRRVLQAWGLIENRIMASNMAERMGGTYEETPRLQRFANRFFENTLLSPLTRAQRQAVMVTIPVWMNVLAQDYNSKGSSLKKQAAIDEFVEMGVPENRIPAFVDYVLEMQGGLPSVDQSYEPETMPQMYMRAIGYVADHVIQNPSVIDRPRMANSPAGRFAYGLMSYSFAYWDNIIKRTAQKTKTEASRGGVPAAALFAARIAPAFAAHYMLATVVFSLRTALFNWEKWDEIWEDDEEKVFGVPKFLLKGGFAYSSPIGPIGDLLYNMITAVKYQKDLANYFVGAQASVPIQIMQEFLNYAINNSENTPTQEKKMVEAAYRTLVSIPSSMAVGMFPGGSLIGTAYGLANMFIASRGAEKALSTAIYGEDEKKKKKTAARTVER